MKWTTITCATLSVSFARHPSLYHLTYLYCITCPMWLLPYITWATPEKQPYHLIDLQDAPVSLERHAYHWTYIICTSRHIDDDGTYFRFICMHASQGRPPSFTLPLDNVRLFRSINTIHLWCRPFDTSFVFCVAHLLWDSLFCRPSDTISKKLVSPMWYAQNWCVAHVI